MGTNKNTKNSRRANDACVGADAIPSIVNGLTFAVKNNVLALGRISMIVSGLSDRLDAIEKAIGLEAKECAVQRVQEGRGCCADPWFTKLSFMEAAKKVVNGSKYQIPPNTCFCRIAGGTEDGYPVVEFQFLCNSEDYGFSANVSETFTIPFGGSYESTLKAFDAAVDGLVFVRFLKKGEKVSPKKPESHTKCKSAKAVCRCSNVPDRQTNGSAVPPPEPESTKPAAPKTKARKAPKTVMRKYEVSVSDPRQVREDLRAMSRYDIPENRITVGQIEYNKKSRRYAFPIIFWSCAGRPSRTNEEIQFRVYRNTDDLDSIVARFDKAVKNLKKVKFQEKEKAND